MGTPSLKGIRVVADRNACCGYGVCAEICPEVYKLDDNGIVVIGMDRIPSELEEKAREGASACPQSALQVHED